MPSESALILDEKLGATRRAYRSAIVETSEELRGILETEHKSGDVYSKFSSGYIDPSSFGALSESSVSKGTERARLSAARSVLVELLGLGDDLYRVEVAPGKSVCCAVSQAYGRIGRAFAAARAASNASAGIPAAADELESLQRNNFHNWSKAERNLAPGLLIEVAGEDLLADGLLAFLDGNACLAFHVTGQVSPAPLVGLIRPDIFVAQSKTHDPFGMPDRGPVAVAVLADAETSATFTHLAAGKGESGMGIWSRLFVDTLPEAAPVSALGPKTVNQQREELRQLASLSIEPLVSEEGEPSAPQPWHRVAAAMAEASPSGGPIDRLAAWLLSKAK